MSLERNYIDLLPDEVLCMVFEHLKLKHLKNASLTCQRWYNIIFESGYIDRFKLNISILDNSFLRRPRQLRLNQLLVLAKQVVEQTERPYRRLRLGIEPHITRQFGPFWNIIHPKITQNLRVLRIYFIEGSVGKTFSYIIDAIPSMSQLKSLSASEHYIPPLYRNCIPIIRSKSIEHLFMECKFKFRIDMPQLQTFKGALNALESPDKSSQPNVFGNLRHLIVHVKGWKSTDLSIFGRMPCLETIDWGVIIPDRLFITLKEMCPSLIEFRLPKNLFLLDMVILNPLFNVAQLRRLFLHNIVMYRTKNPVLNFSKLTQLEELDLGKTVLQPNNLLNLPKTIRKLGLYLDPKNELSFIDMRYDDKYEQNLIDFIICNLPQLTELRIEYDHTPLSEYIIKFLPALEHLEILQFTRCNFKQSVFLGMDAPLHRLHTLRFAKCKLETKDLLGLKDKFPSLKRRKFLESYIINEPKESSDSELDDEIEIESNPDANLDGDEYDDYDMDQSDNELDDLMENELNADPDPAGDEYNDCNDNLSGSELDDSMEIESNSDTDFNGFEYDDNSDYEGSEYDYYDFIESTLFLDSATMST